METKRKKILILGGGFGGLYCAKKLEGLISKHKGSDIEIMLVSRQNFFVFTPMLPQVVSGMIESNHVVVPLRQVLKNTKFYEAEIASIDVSKKRVDLLVEKDNSGNTVYGNEPALTNLAIDYDHLVVSLGSETNFPKSSNFAHLVFTLKNLRDALLVRNHIIDMLERADIETDPVKRRQMLNFVIVGGGLSGIETAAELNAFLRKVVKYYPNLKAKVSEPPHVTIVQSRDRILPELNLKLASETLQKMSRDGISIILDTKVIDVEEGFVRTLGQGGEQLTLPASTVIWTVGIAPNPLTASLACEKLASGRPVVDSFLRVKGCEDVWAVGDSACIIDEVSGEPFPATAQHALRESKIAAENIMKKLQNNNTGLRKFRYNRDAQMALIGSRSAIANMAGVNLSGFLIWCLWRAVYLKKLPMFKKRLRVALDWTIDIFFDPDLTHLRGLKADRHLENHPKQVESN